MNRFPVLSTLVVAAAVAVMIGLGLWQLRRAEWKDELLALHRGAAELPMIEYPTSVVEGQLPLYRRATGNCERPLSRRAVAGSNRQGETGYAHIVDCATAGPAVMPVVIGWSRDPNAKISWAGGPVSGIVAPDREHKIRLVADRSPAGLEPSAPPTAETIPNNHRSYAIQWFAFAAIALVIYVLALRGRMRVSP
jgi:cytochrome oxidase assembly protein ShyY1